MMRGTAATALLLSLACSAWGAEFVVSDDFEVVGESRVIKARYEDTFVSLARTHNVGFESLRRANPGVDAWLPGEGTEIVIPHRFVLPRAPREGIVINVAELRLYYYPKPEPGAESRRVITHPISIGRMDWKTPLGTTTVVGKAANPTWYPPQSIRDEHAARDDFLPAVVPPGPDNPLGKHALRLGLPGYLIHGTNRPSGVGMRVTHGCIRMFPEDIESLFDMVPTGTKVHIVNQPYKLGWAEDGLHLEAHPPLAEEGAEEAEWGVTELTRAYVAATDERRAEVRWDLAERVMLAARGIPEFVAVESSLSEPGTETVLLD
jgi:L,D-transpeptidase ErfK/SrfK